MADEIISPPPQPIPKEPLFSAFYRKYKKIFWTSLVTLAAAIAVLLVWVLFLRTKPAAPAYEGEVKVSITAPKTAPSGSQVSYEITVDNGSNTALTDITLEVFYPRGFVFENSTPEGQGNQGRKFVLANMPSGDSQKLIAIGSLAGSVQEVKVINAKLHYRPEIFRAAFVAESSSNTVILAPEISLKLDAPAQLVTGQTINYLVEMKNVSDKPFSNIVLEAAYPDKFELTGTEGGPRWEFAELKIGETKTITISGRLTEEASKESLFQIEMFLKDAEGELVAAGRAYAFTRILASPLLLSHKLVNIPEEVLPGADLAYEVEYENKGSLGLNDVVISVEFATDAFDFAELEPETGQYRTNSSIGSGRVLAWFSGSERELLVVQPGQRGRFTFRIPVSDQLVQRRQKNPLLTTKTYFQSKELTEPLAGNTLELKVDTEANAAVKTEVVGGAEKPATGQSTTYRVEISVTNTVNDLKNAVLQAIIPRSETRFDQSSITPADERERVEYASSSGSLRWDLGSVFALTGSFHSARTLKFDLTVTPGVGESPQALELLRDVKLEAIDDFTDKKISTREFDVLNSQ